MTFVAGNDVATSIAKHSRVKSSPTVSILRVVPLLVASKIKSTDQTSPGRRNQQRGFLLAGWLAFFARALLDLKVGAFPQAMHPVQACGLPCPFESDPCLARAASCAFLSKLGQCRHKRSIRIGFGNITDTGSAYPKQPTGMTLGNATRLKEGNCRGTLRRVGYFFCRNSLRTSTSMSRSASRRLRRAFSFSNSLSRLASERVMPP